MNNANYVLITGASSGIGRAISVVLSSSYNLVLHGRDIERLEETRSSCNPDHQYLIWSYDLKVLDGLAESLTDLLHTHDIHIEHYVHSAGMVTVLPIRAMTYPLAQESMNVNMLSAMEIASTLMKKKVNQQQLRAMVFISSIWSRFGARGYSSYCASKGALDGLTKALAVELAPEVRVNSILPGAIPTSMAEQGFADPEIMARLQQDYPLGTGDPSDIAYLVEFLLSAKARWITGQQLTVDGGRTVNMSLK